MISFLPHPPAPSPQGEGEINAIYGVIHPSPSGEGLGVRWLREWEKIWLKIFIEGIEDMAFKTKFSIH